MSSQVASNQKKRKKIFSIFILIVLILAICSAFYYFIFVAGNEETEDAYVSGRQVIISPEVSGRINNILVDNLDFVSRGDVLATLDKQDLQLRFEQAKNNLALSLRQQQQQVYVKDQLKAQLNQAKIDLEQSRDMLARRQKLDKSGAVTKEVLDQAKNKFAAAKAGYELISKKILAFDALLLDTPVVEQPSVKLAISNLKTAWLNLYRSEIKSPVDGYVARRYIQIGAQTSPATPLMVIIPKEQMWVEANFKETQLKEVKAGQKASIVFDFYGKDITFDGTVGGIEWGTGSAFSILPPQNASGNWIKVVQRIPVRIYLDPKQIEQYPLRLGLSSRVKIDLNSGDDEKTDEQNKNLDKPANIAQLEPIDETVINNIIDQIIKSNTAVN